MVGKKGLLIAVMGVLLTGCWQEGPNWLDCEDFLDTVEVIQEAERGGWLLQDSLFLWAGTKPYDRTLCDSIGLRVAPIATPSGKQIACTISDLYPPFKLYKKSGTDTLYVFQNGKTLIFQIDKQFCD